MPRPGKDLAFTDEDRAMVRRFLGEQRVIHAPCGHPLDETTDPRKAPGWLAEEVTCNACAAKTSYERAAAENAREGGTDNDGVFFVPYFDASRVPDRG